MGKSSYSYGRALLIPLLLGAIGFLGNWFKLSLFFNVDFLFGSFFVMLAIARYGVAAAMVSGVIAASCSYLLWNHPWAIIIFSAEALFVALCHRRKPGYLLLHDTLYWLFIGMPLVWLFYHVVMGIPLQATYLIALKQSINGIVNALLATLVMYGFQVFRSTAAGDRTLIPLREIIFTTVVSVTLLPTLAYFVTGVRERVRDEESVLCDKVLSVTESAQVFLGTWLSSNHQTVIALSKSVGDPASSSFDAMQQQVANIKLSNSNIMRLGVFDANARSVAYQPLVDPSGATTLGVDFSDRPYIPTMKTNLAPLVPDVVMGKLNPPMPILPLLAPIVIGGSYRGYCAGVVDFAKLGEQLKILAKGRNSDITLIDRSGKVVISTAPQRASLQKFERPAGGQQRSMKNGVYHWIPQPDKKTSIMQRWKSSLFVKEATLTRDTPWTIVVESSLLPFLTFLNQKTIDEFQQLWIILLMTLITAHFLSKRISSSINCLALTTSELPQKLTGKINLEWPDSKIEEINSLTANFRSVSAALGASFNDLRAWNEQLEQRVKERTHELADINEQLELEMAERQEAQEALAEKSNQLQVLNLSLQQRIDEAITELRRKDQLMISQGRQAAMGEMIGNIAHQWRQPLNALSMVFGNISAAYQYNELTASYLEKTLENGSRLIQKMSTTINDFRNFFRPDKEIVTFSARTMISHAVELVDASLVDQNITVEIDAPDDLLLTGYPNEYSQVLLNLISNSRDAIKASSVAAGKISIRLSSEDGQGIVSFSDNGGGIPPDVLDKIFDPYFSTKEMGTGIGLYMSKMIIERNMNGTITVHNINAGTEFRIVTPLDGRTI
ncbi:MAG: ATP-binding protein [Desulfuromonadales bacterium]